MTIAAFPLSWPQDLPRTENKKPSQFKSSLSAALNNVKGSLERFGKDMGRPVTDVVLSSNVGGLDPGTIRDTGVAAWFKWDGEQRCIAVDRYPKVEDNLQAIHHIIEARRTEYRHGGLHIVRQTFRGFTALPAPAGQRGWREVLQIAGPATKAKIDEKFRALAAAAHPDKPGGSNEKMQELTVAKAQAMKAIGGE